jgi:hypothetical protein
MATWGLIFTVAFHTNDFARIVTVTAPALAYRCVYSSLISQQVEIVCQLSSPQRPTGDVHGLGTGFRFEGIDQNSRHIHDS